MQKFNFYLILLIVFALPSYLLRLSIFGVPTTVLELLIYISAIITIIQSVKFKVHNYSSKFKIIFIPLILLVTGGIVGIVVSPDKMVALGQFKAYIFDPILFFWILSANIHSQDELKYIYYAFFCSGFYVAGYSIYEYLISAPTENGRIIGIFGYSPNYAAMYLAPLFVVGCYLTYHDRKRNYYYLVFNILLLVGVLMAIFLSGSRGAMFTIIGSISLAYIIKYIINLKNIVYKYILSFLVILAILCVGYYIIKPDFSVIGNDPGRIGSSNNIRYEIYKTTILSIIPHDLNWLWGIGLGNYQNYFTDISSGWTNYPEYIAPKALTAHNLFLHTYVNIGLVGLVAFVWMLIVFFKSVNLKNFLSYITFVLMLCIMIIGIVDTPYWKNDYSIIFWILIFSSLMFNKLNSNTKNVFK